MDFYIGILGEFNSLKYLNRFLWKSTKHLSCFSFICFLVVAVLTVFPNEANSAWNPIIGIPEPPFGVNEVAPPVPDPWNTETSGFYYINHTSGADTNAYGTPDNPRKTVPSTLPAGSVVEVHGLYNGQYDGKKSDIIVSQGKVNNPVYIRGETYTNRPTITVKMVLKGSYLIVENVRVAPYDSGSQQYGFRMYEPVDHITIRNCEIDGSGSLYRNSAAIGIGTWNSLNVPNGAESQYILVDNCYFHEMGNINPPTDEDSHGIAITGFTHNIWIVNNIFEKISGNGVQIEAKRNRKEYVHHVYIGENVAFANRQSGFSVKNATDVILSENTSYGHLATEFASPGPGFSVNYCPDYVWFLFNKSYDNATGIAIQHNDGDIPGENLFIIGNLIYNIHASDEFKLNVFGSGGITTRGDIDNVYVINNTFYGVDSGINHTSDTGRLVVVNNIISKRTEFSMNDIYIKGSNSAASSIIENNIFYSSYGFSVKLGAYHDTSLAEFQARTGTTGSLTSDPLFIDPLNNNFMVQAGSPAINGGVLSTVYDLFKTRYGIDIARDIKGTSRPKLLWDIGAYEKEELAPMAPTNLKIVPLLTLP